MENIWTTRNPNPENMFFADCEICRHHHAVLGVARCCNLFLCFNCSINFRVDQCPNCRRAPFEAEYLENDGVRQVVGPRDARIPQGAIPANFVPVIRRRRDGNRDRRFRRDTDIGPGVPGPLRGVALPDRYHPYAPPPPPPPPAAQPHVQRVDAELNNVLFDVVVAVRRFVFEVTDRLARYLRPEQVNVPVVPIPPPAPHPATLMPLPIPRPPVPPGPMGLMGDFNFTIEARQRIDDIIRQVRRDRERVEDDEVRITGHAYHPGQPAHRYN